MMYSNKNKLSSIFIILIVISVHILLLYGLLGLKKQKLSSKYGSLQMVQVSLELPKPEIKEIPKVESQEKIKEKILTTKAEENKPVDVLKEEKKIEKKKKLKKKIKKKKPKKKKKIKKKTIKKKKKIVKKKRVEPKQIVKEVETVIPTQQVIKESPVSNEVVGDGGLNHDKNVKKKRGSSKVGASLGAGFGFALKGQCSSSSDDADDFGDVKVRVIISPSGKSKEVQIIKSSGIKRLDRQAKKIARRHTYSPARQNGKTVEGSVVFTIHFRCGNA